MEGLGPAASMAPMEGVTILPTRLWLHWASAPRSMTTPFLRVTEAHPLGQLPFGFVTELQELRGVLPYELTPQLLGADPEHVLRTADLLPPELAPMIELNCGCPSPNSAGKTAGSGALRDPDWFHATVERLATTWGPGRLAVKMRLGLNDPSEFDALLEAVASLPLGRLTVHGRTRADGYRGSARWDLIGKAAATAKAPTWASGDVLGAKKLADLAAVAPRVAGVMVGRGALRNPWIFTELASGVPVELRFATLADALLSFAAVHDLWLKSPAKLVARVANGHWREVAGASEEGWQRLASALTGMAFGVPFVGSTAATVSGVTLSPVALARLKFLWSHLRTGLPSEFMMPKLMRSRSLAEFFTLLGGVEEGRPGSGKAFAVGHQPQWDELFAGARGAP